MIIPTKLDLDQVSVLAEIIVRGGDVRDPKTRQFMQASYRPRSRHYGIDGRGVNGLSVLINVTGNQPTTYFALAQRNPLPNRQLSISVVGAVKAALKSAGYTMILYSTPSKDLPDHHSLVVARVNEDDKHLDELPDDAADAIISVLTVVQPNPYPKQRS